MPNLSTTRRAISGIAFLALIVIPFVGLQGQTQTRQRSSAIASAPPEQAGGKEDSGSEKQTDSTEDNTNHDGEIHGDQNGINPGLNEESLVATDVRVTLNRDVDLEVSTTLGELPDQLRKLFGIPVLLDARGIEYSRQVLSQALEFNETEVPLRTALRRTLEPMGLKAVVENDGLIVTADLHALSHAGIGISKWTNMDGKVEKVIAKKLDSPTEFSFVEEPLSAALVSISKKHDLTLLMDVCSLEEIGLSGDQPVTMSLQSIKLKDALGLMLGAMELTYTIQHNVLIITTEDAAASKPLTRIYRLEDTGFATGDSASIILAIRSSVQPESWAESGGESMITPLDSARPAILVSTTYRTHKKIEQLLSALRESHFGPCPAPAKLMGPAVDGGMF